MTAPSVDRPVGRRAVLLSVVGFLQRTEGLQRPPEEAPVRPQRTQKPQVQGGKRKEPPTPTTPLPIPPQEPAPRHPGVSSSKNGQEASAPGASPTQSPSKVAPGSSGDKESTAEGNPLKTALDALEDARGKWEKFESLCGSFQPPMIAHDPDAYRSLLLNRVGQSPPSRLLEEFRQMARVDLTAMRSETDAVARIRRVTAQYNTERTRGPIYSQAVKPSQKVLRGKGIRYEPLLSEVHNLATLSGSFSVPYQSQHKKDSDGAPRSQENSGEPQNLDEHINQSVVKIDVFTSSLYEKNNDLMWQGSKDFDAFSAQINEHIPGLKEAVAAAKCHAKQALNSRLRVMTQLFGDNRKAVAGQLYLRKRAMWYLNTAEEFFVTRRTSLFDVRAMRLPDCLDAAQKVLKELQKTAGASREERKNALGRLKPKDFR